MKKLFCFIPILIILLLCACTADKKAETPQSTKKPSPAVQQSPGQENDAEKAKPDDKSQTEDETSSDINKTVPDVSEVASSDTSSYLSGKIIVIDPGHGLFSNGYQEAVAPGSSQTKPAFVSGTAGKNQTEEELNLAVALRLKEELEKRGAVVHMTRETHQTELSNIGRAQFANELGADISVKIHADGSENSSLKGISMLIPGSQYVSDSNLILQSDTAGKLVLEAVIESTGAIDRGVVARNDMTGFNWSTVPVILLEMGFMTNSEEDALMETDEYQNKIVNGIVNGLENYFKN